MTGKLWENPSSGKDKEFRFRNVKFEMQINPPKGRLRGQLATWAWSSGGEVLGQRNNAISAINAWLILKAMKLDEIRLAERRENVLA